MFKQEKREAVCLNDRLPSEFGVNTTKEVLLNERIPRNGWFLSEIPLPNPLNRKGFRTVDPTFVSSNTFAIYRNIWPVHILSLNGRHHMVQKTGHNRYSDGQRGEN